MIIKVKNSEGDANPETQRQRDFSSCIIRTQRSYFEEQKLQMAASTSIVTAGMRPQLLSSH